MMGTEVRVIQPRAMESWELLEAGKARKQVLLLNPQKEHSPVETLILGLLASRTLK